VNPLKHNLVLSLACVALLCAPVASAHDNPISTLTVSVERQTVRLVLVVHTDELGLWQPPAPSASPAVYAASAAARLEKEARDLFELRVNYQVVAPSSVRAKAETPEVVRAELEYATGDVGEVTALQVFSNLVPKLSPEHKQVLSVQDARSAAAGTEGRVVAWHTLTPGQYTAFVQIPPAPEGATASTTPATHPVATTAPTTSESTSGDAPAGVAPFFKLGVEHILTGYDHLLFLAALLLVCATFREAATIVTCFTLAHSITLALAALDVVRLPAGFVEPVIAASIVYVAVENVVRFRKERQRLAWRAAITFAFGLVHGLGFASVLRELGLGSLPGGVVVPLLTFNLGVEAGQLAVAAVVFPLILLARRGGPVMERRWVPACSALIAAAGAWWLFERVALG
jgi:hydrogenase/urease accessory protein HupE